MARLTTATADYATELQTLSEGSVNLHFDPFVDIDWDAPDMVVDKNDPRWVLPAYDPLAKTDWYQGLSHERQIEVGLWRQANVAKVGLQFESLLIRGMQQYIMTLPNGSPEFRYCLHEITEECNHIQMFQELVNRIGVDTPGMDWWIRPFAPFVPLMSFLPVPFFIMVLGGEEPIDHYQKAIARSGDDIPPILGRITAIHIAEEARHISFAHKFIEEHLKDAGPIRRAITGAFLAIIMRSMATIIMAPPVEFRRKFKVPRSAWRQAFWRSPESKQMLVDFFADVRTLAVETRLLTPRSRWLWKLLGIYGDTARYRSEPMQFRRA
ncbi:diiron oxygenase [Pseudonocardiaceae bacterium YIM PH 21723]|nr:diiron oxygenase [Pseudonocardiaceae bacterium YIM PH 21723]